MNDEEEKEELDDKRSRERERQVISNSDNQKQRHHNNDDNNNNNNTVKTKQKPFKLWLSETNKHTKNGYYDGDLLPSASQLPFAIVPQQPS